MREKQECEIYEQVRLRQVEGANDVNDTDGQHGYLLQSPSPIGRHCSTASLCCRGVPGESQLKTRNWVPSQ